MKRIAVNLGSVENVKKFCDIVEKKEYRIDMVSERYVVNAKSVVGVLCADLSKPITIEADCSDDEFKELCEELKDFLVK